MHSPNEMVAVEDVENCARVIAAYVKDPRREHGFRPLEKSCGDDREGPEGRRQEAKRPALVEASLLLTVFFFGTNFTAVKYVVESVPPILFAATRFTLAGLLLLVSCASSSPAAACAGRTSCLCSASESSASPSPRRSSPSG
jgi:hypothetical protein